MKKQEVIDEIENAIPDFILNDYQRGKETGLTYALELVEELDEPEKPFLSKEEAEWLERLKKVKSFLNCLYIITRQGWGHDFEFYVHEERHKLSYRDDNDEDSEQTKNRLVNALIYGYEVEKEKLYTVELPNPNSLDYLMLQKDRRGKISVAWYCTDSWREDERVRLTEAEIKEDFAWAWQFAEEVEE
ncbi:DUF1642 domain-containing protein [Streptococcus gallolyticus subsp. gallolyticus]|uniref:DUF1642 domain-containing protein n=1 Tax=Streptococcus gallolyticus TaxID=315405 RepID=UPI002284C8A5|nr:DUF1642 domain-containing protein [Streptococcus gallolyticus]MCY7173658.1 DUF1642 domain-containing protein [Streptococcus gallolyticus subsp. gallolyticus]MCY7175779.1 DUF1642 domain-containing protein [Streptococcus gallolyticus subsp. gallolyticus]MCY7180233.1 DUF1642 domain-containing protein [Streptococcus gallolyticus subsp. gallolyticus]MCY7197785.1 DUF1642 domain-containing protein [Streptococcus gallolyticus subsp. gallolyticus]MCY7204218.1 DUF1642 domain-containing protein [Strep